jgi:CRP/FNR family transcriptional regulator, cyclic AMP receptor protein
VSAISHTMHNVNQEILDGLKKVGYLSDLKECQLDSLAEKAITIQFPKYATIITEGDVGNSLYIILSGKVRVFTRNERNKEITLLLQEPGTSFGELALLADAPRSASVSAIEPTHCAIISKTEFIEWLMANPVVSIALMGMLTDKIRQLTLKVKKMALSNVYERTIQVLDDLSTLEGDNKVIRNRPSQQDLAAMVGASREMVNKVMQELTKGGYLVVRDKVMIFNKKFPNSW